MENKSDNLITNGNIFDRKANFNLTFTIGDKFFMENESYVGNFLVLGIEKNTGITFVRASGASSNGEAIFDLSYLRRQYTTGKLKMNPENL